MKKIYISQPMRGKCMNDIMAERKKLVAEADAVIFAAGWRDARVCRCERIIAAEYGLRILDAQPKG